MAKGYNKGSSLKKRKGGHIINQKINSLSHALKPRLLQMLVEKLIENLSYTIMED